MNVELNRRLDGITGNGGGNKTCASSKKILGEDLKKQTVCVCLCNERRTTL